MLRGGGGGFTLIFFVKLDFEIAVDQQTRAVTKLVRGFQTPVPAGQRRPYLVSFWPNLAKAWL